MQISQREYNILQIAFDIKDYLSSYREDVLENLLKRDDIYSNYDIVMTIFNAIDEEGADFNHLKNEFTEILEYGMDELATGTLDLNFGRELTLVSRIIYELENINWVPTKAMSPLPDLAAEF